ncbi:putative DNA-binding protein (MmcQ/YjbR family) [Spinactinospora alkalitolerans]|uniref:Putative DNA-binding protein (MmcQ/YjbR family) n=1 Tax=Spinactinospora alkalitolerans TaxID=687207 RepID=A0A852U4C8_9ACTN|nr:MmcQ/YjbR family DNA-binding protein [Spinactinospora alkalitolerans]NYE50457.1 putative DNA-binding protein (MmcQ/YjbR family) [Spinactinospora alkalitolerans]
MLSGEQLQQIARRTADSPPGVSNGRPFTQTLDVYKVTDKVFLIVTDDPDELVITVKAEPDHGSALRREHPTITRGRYPDKDHWVSVGAGSGIGEDLIEDLVEGSYQRVRDALPRKEQPDST